MARTQKMSNQNDTSNLHFPKSDQKTNEFQNNDEIWFFYNRAIQRQKRQCRIHKKQVHT